jgi:hypothetical protein
VKPSNKTAFFLMLIFWLFYLSPFVIPGLNQLEPRLFGFPLTVWEMWVAIILSWIVTGWASQKVWDTFDGGEEGDNK